jgi:hypothetical protein
MKRIAFAVLAFGIVFTNSFAADEVFKWIFVPHARTEATSGDMIITGIRNIDFTKFSLKMLGGDLCQATSKDSATMAYCDKFFDFGNPNTLWSIGNHDVESGSRATIKKFTKRDTYYSYARDGVQFLILDTELDATSFSGTQITGVQLDTVKAVCNRITSADTKFLIVLNSRYIWMVNNSDFSQAFKDSNVAASSKSMTTSNFSTDIYPLLKAVKAKGIQPLWLSGDKIRTNVNNYIYKAADSIPFYAAKMENSDPDSTNYVVILTYTKNKKMSVDYVKLTHVNSWITGTLPNATVYAHSAAEEQALQVRQAVGKKEIAMTWQAANDENGMLQIFGLDGALYHSQAFKTNKTITVSINRPGVYVVKGTFANGTQSKKFVVR